MCKYSWVIEYYQEHRKEYGEEIHHKFCMKWLNDSKKYICVIGISFSVLSYLFAQNFVYAFDKTGLVSEEMESESFADKQDVVIITPSMWNLLYNFDTSNRESCIEIIEDENVNDKFKMTLLDDKGVIESELIDVNSSKIHSVHFSYSIFNFFFI